MDHSACEVSAIPQTGITALFDLMMLRSDGRRGTLISFVTVVTAGRLAWTTYGDEKWFVASGRGVLFAFPNHHSPDAKR